MTEKTILEKSDDHGMYRDRKNGNVYYLPHVEARILRRMVAVMWSDELVDWVNIH
jgi:hypothetical protein